MSTKELLRAEIETTPEEIVREVYDFLHYLKHKNSQAKNADLYLAESALGKDWLSAEEDAAWRDL